MRRSRGTAGLPGEVPSKCESSFAHPSSASLWYVFGHTDPSQPSPLASQLSLQGGAEERMQWELWLKEVNRDNRKQTVWDLVWYFVQGSAFQKALVSGSGLDIFHVTNNIKHSSAIVTTLHFSTLKMGLVCSLGKFPKINALCHKG